MAINKVVFGNQTLIDISDATVTADKLLSGIVAYDKTGTKITGTATTGMKVITGSFTGTSSTHSISVSGLDFTPKGCAYMLLGQLGDSNTSVMLMGATVPVKTTSSGSNIYAVRRSGSSSFTNITGSPSLTSNGFTHSNSNGNFGGTYLYIVWG